MQVTNQKPAKLTPVYVSSITGAFDPVESMKKTIVDPLFSPLIANTAVSITDDSGNNMTRDDIGSAILNCCGDTVNANAESACREIYGKTLLYYDLKCPLGIQNLFAVQAGCEAKLPYPQTQALYTPVDIIQISKGFLAGQKTYEELLGTFAYYSRSETFAVYFCNTIAFDQFKVWIDQQLTTTNMYSQLPAETNKLVSDFKKLTLTDLTESIKIRNNENDNNQDYSFARLLMMLFMSYTAHVSSTEFGIMPFNVSELFCPKSVVMINIEKHARASAKQINDEWDTINKSLQMKINIINNNTLNSLTGTMRHLKSISSAAVSAANSANNSPARAARIAFRVAEPTAIDIAKIIKKIASKMGNVMKSENVYKEVRMSYNKPNRREPDNYNKMGKSVSTKYRPDIHIYIDTSGSVSEENYQDAIKACITMSKTMGVNFYFNSFSDSLSQCTKLELKNMSARRAYAKFQTIPKVTGGTDYEQIWHYINRSQTRRKRLSVIITDFAWSPPNHYVKHPKNLYYMPLSKMNWDDMVDNAKEFCESMTNIEPTIRSRVLM